MGFAGTLESVAKLAIFLIVASDVVSAACPSSP